MRRWQQSYLWQIILLPILTGFGGSLLAAGCLKDGIDHISRACVMGAVNTTIIAGVTVFLSGHSPGSASFNPDGTKNEAVVMSKTQ